MLKEMRIIKILKDIELLKKSHVVQSDILQEIEKHFKHIYNNIGEGIPIEEFYLVYTGMTI